MNLTRRSLRLRRTNTPLTSTRALAPICLGCDALSKPKRACLLPGKPAEVQSVSAKFVIDLVNVFAQLVQVPPKDIRVQIVTLRVQIEGVQIHIVVVRVYIEEVRVHIEDVRVHIEDVRVHIEDIRVLSKAFGNWRLAIGSIFIV